MANPAAVCNLESNSLRDLSLSKVPTDDLVDDLGAFLVHAMPTLDVVHRAAMHSCSRFPGATHETIHCTKNDDGRRRERIRIGDRQRPPFELSQARVSGI